MESGSFKLLESATQKTLHAHGFSRSSSQASCLLTDLLSRYLTLLTSTSGKYAQHAGRTGLNVRDALGALGDLGISLEELNEYCSAEGKELNRYALHSVRRVEDLNEFRAQLSDGLRQDHDDAIHLEYTRYTTPLSDESEDSDDYEQDGEGDDIIDHSTEDIAGETDVEMSPPSQFTFPLRRKRTSPQPSTPPLPLSPVSNNSSPSRKRPRTATWEPPPHIPDHLPPFPSITEDPPSPGQSYHTQATQIVPLPSQVENMTVDKPTAPLTEAITSSAASDYLVQVPYSQSSLASVSEWHLPQSFPVQAVPRSSRLPTPQTEQSLLAAYHHILTHPPPVTPASSNPLRHKVAMALLSQTQNISRWDPPDTLYSSIGPCPPRVTTIGPTYPIAVSELDTKGKGESKDKDFKFPPTISRAVSANERLSPLVSQQSSRIPDLARHILPPTIFARTSRLTHPPVLYRGTKPLIYGPGIPAPWNANTLTPSGEPTAQTPTATKSKDSLAGTDKDLVTKPAIPDARLFATWEYEPKDFRVHLPRGRSRLGSMQAGTSSGVISLSVGPRTKSNK